MLGIFMSLPFSLLELPPQTHAFNMMFLACTLPDPGYHLRNHHTTIKNQKTMIRKTMYHRNRQPCRSAMLFIRLNVPDKIPPVSANASF